MKLPYGERAIVDLGELQGYCLDPQHPDGWASGVYEVEFCDGDGKTYAMVALKAEQLIGLHHQPVHQAA